MTPKTSNDGFKAAAAKLVPEQGYPASQAADSLGGDPSSIRRWVRILADTAVALPDASAEELRRDNLRLREENRRLLMGREILPLNASIARSSFSADSTSRFVPTLASA